MLSPILFLLVIDPLQQQMESIKLGPYFAGRFLGASAHADDIRTVTSSLNCLERQVSLVQEFASQNGLQLNTNKCELMIALATRTVDTVLNTSMDSNRIETKHCQMPGLLVVMGHVCKGSSRGRYKESKKGILYVQLRSIWRVVKSPLSGKAIFEICVLPVLLYGSENWILNTSLLSKLKHFKEKLNVGLSNFLNTTLQSHAQSSSSGHL